MNEREKALSYYLAIKDEEDPQYTHKFTYQNITIYEIGDNLKYDDGYDLCCDFWRDYKRIANFIQYMSNLNKNLGWLACSYNRVENMYIKVNTRNTFEAIIRGYKIDVKSTKAIITKLNGEMHEIKLAKSLIPVRDFFAEEYVKGKMKNILW